MSGLAQPTISRIQGVFNGSPSTRIDDVFSPGASQLSLSQTDRRTFDKIVKMMDEVCRECRSPRLNLEHSPPCILDILPETYQLLCQIFTNDPDLLKENQYIQVFIENLSWKCKAVLQLFGSTAVYGEQSPERLNLTKYSLIFSQMLSELKAEFPNGTLITTPVTSSSATSSVGNLPLTTREIKRRLETNTDSPPSETTSVVPIPQHLAPLSSVKRQKVEIICGVCRKDLGGDYCVGDHCIHEFHRECLLTWLIACRSSQQSCSCPTCRDPVSTMILYSEQGEEVGREPAPPLPTPKEEILGPDDYFCRHCGRGDREHVLLLCEECDGGAHIDCLPVPLSEVPQELWICRRCERRRIRWARRHGVPVPAIGTTHLF